MAASRYSSRAVRRTMTAERRAWRQTVQMRVDSLIAQLCGGRVLPQWAGRNSGTSCIDRSSVHR